MKPWIGLVAAVLLTGCGMTNKALRADHHIKQLAQDAGDDMVEVARVSVELSASAPYNAKYTLKARLPVGDFVARGTDGQGGRYFVHRDRQPVLVTYAGVEKPGESAPERLPGGLFVGPSGAAEIYWHWDGDFGAAVRVPVPAMQVVVGREIDPERRRARLAVEEAAAQARRKAREWEAQKARLAEVRQQARVQCEEAQCERAFAKAQAYLLLQTDMRIQVATPTLIETYNATSAGQVQMRLLRVPISGQRWEIRLTAHCREDSGAYEEVCAPRLISALGGFLPYMQRD